MKEDKPIAEVMSSYLAEAGAVLEKMPKDEIERIVRLRRISPAEGA